MRLLLTRLGILAVVAFLAVGPGLVLPADAAARVTITNSSGDAVIDPTYATTLTVRGRGFQSIKNGHGGIYVLFGVVEGAWKPSQNGSGGYLSVPDAQAQDNAGYAKFVSFPGSDTEGSANGGVIGANGAWSTRLTVPGATFSTTDARGKVVRIDCRVRTCGVITIGAHGVANVHNESFTPVRVAKASTPGATPQATQGTAPRTTSTIPTGTAPVAAPASPVAAATPALEVDRASAKPGRVLSFSAVGLDPGSQVSATFEDGAAAVGPMTVGATGQVAGVLQLPAGLGTGTYELRIVGGAAQPAVRFAVVAPISEHRDASRWPLVFAAGSAAVLAAAVVVAGRRRSGRRRAA